MSNKQYAIKENKCVEEIKAVKLMNLGSHMKNQEGVIYIRVDKQSELINFRENLILKAVLTDTFENELHVPCIARVDQNEQTITIDGTYISSSKSYNVDIAYVGFPFE